MDTDLLLVIGIVLGGFAIPSMISAFSESRAPRTATVVAVISGCLIALAVSQKPSGYALSDVPDAFVRVIGKYIR